MVQFSLWVLPLLGTRANPSLFLFQFIWVVFYVVINQPSSPKIQMGIYYFFLNSVFVAERICRKVKEYYYHYCFQEFENVFCRGLCN